MKNIKNITIEIRTEEEPLEERILDSWWLRKIDKEKYELVSAVIDAMLDDKKFLKQIDNLFEDYYAD